MFQTACSKFCRQLVLDALSRGKHGELRVMMPGSACRLFGGLGKELHAKITIKNERFYRRCVLDGALGLAESYLHDEWETPNLTHVIAWFLLNSNAFDGITTEKHHGRKVDFLRSITRFKYFFRVSKKKKSREHLQDHYSLGTSFFKTWLGPTMTESAAYYLSPADTLEEAQLAKWEQFCQKLRLEPHDYLLDVGCGWGDFAIYAAKKYGCRIQATTVSEEQFHEAAERVEKAGVADLVEVVFCDYRELSGRFDKIVSIEMLQAVGDGYIESFFSKMEELLAPRGLLALQVALAADNKYPLLRDNVDFIQKHIAPGSLIMSLRRMTDALNATSNLNLLDAEDITPSAARTALAWRQSFVDALPELRKQGRNPLFLRKWLYYLCCLEAEFATRSTNVAQLLYTRPNNLELKSPLYSLLD